MCDRFGLRWITSCPCISSKFETLGFDISEKRIKELSEKYDPNKEYYKKDFILKKITFSNKTKDLEDSNVYIICSHLY